VKAIDCAPRPTGKACCARASLYFALPGCSASTRQVPAERNETVEPESLQTSFLPTIEYFTGSPELALAVCRSDDEVDKLNGQIFRELLSYMIEEPSSITRALRLNFIAKYFERIGDQATNVCEQVVYMTEARVIKHPRLSLERDGKRLTVQEGGQALFAAKNPGPRQVFQWMETLSGEIVLMSLQTNRYLRVTPSDGALVADIPGPTPDGRDRTRFVRVDRAGR